MKIIKDLIHEYIEISENEKIIIDTPSFQRLKNISQLTTNHLFPSVNHTRFEHSLGVMKLAIDFFESLESQFEKYTDEKKIDKLPRLKEHLRYSALLHDIGHAPYSHLGEHFYNGVEIEEKTLAVLSEKKIFLSDPDILKKGSAHERMSCYCIVKNFYEILSAIDASIDIDLVFRMILGRKYSEQEMWQENIAIEILNSKTIDVDKLDYLLRDNHMAGYPAQKIDVKRLLNALYIDTMKELTFKSNGISSVQTLIDSRDALYLWIYNHHTAVYTDYIVQDLIKYFIAIKDFNKESDKKFPEEIDRKDFFSCEAICERFVSDAEVYSHLNKAYVLSKRLETSKYSSELLHQIFERKFLKPTWKTMYEYLTFEKKYFTDSKVRDRLYIDLIESDDKSYDMRKMVVRKISERLKLKPGEIFFIIRSNKFYYSTKPSNFYIYMDDLGNQPISDLLPQKNYEKYKDISYYLYGREDKIDSIIEEFVKIIHSQEYKK